MLAYTRITVYLQCLAPFASSSQQLFRQLHTPVNIQLAEHRTQMISYGVFRNSEPLGDFSISKPLRCQEGRQEGYDFFTI